VSPILAAARRLRASAILLNIVCVVIAGMTSCARLGPPVADAAPDPATATVLRVVNGDTIDVRGDTRGRLRIRLLGIDTPEVHSQDGQSAAGAPKRPASPRKPLPDNGLPSLRTPRRTPTTATAAASPTLSWLTGGTSLLRRRAPAWPAPMSTTTSR
jgi:hypothetical protein